MITRSWLIGWLAWAWVLTPFLYGLSQLNVKCRARRQENIDPGPEFYKAHLGALLYLLSYRAIVDDPPGQRPGNLFDEDFTMRIADDYTMSFVFRRRFRVPGYEVFPGVILIIDDLASHGIAVLMDICGTHEYGYL